MIIARLKGFKRFFRNLFLKAHILKKSSTSYYICCQRQYSNITDFKQDPLYFDKNLCSRLKQYGYLYISDAKDAECIASYLCSELGNRYILEANPGPAVLTKAILNASIPHVRVFEKNGEFLPQLKELSIRNPGLEIIPEDFLYLPSLETRTSDEETTEYDNFFVNIAEHPWKGGVSCRLFSIISSKRSIKFLRYLLAALPNRSSLFSLGRCEFFFLASESEYSYMCAEAKDNFATYRWVTVLYNLFFDIKYLQKFSTDIFHPLLYKAKRKGSNEQFFHLVKLTPKPDLFSQIINDNKVPEFYFFVRHHLIKRTGLVIPTLEGWIPSCGPRLIKEGMNVFTKFGDLNPKQILLLFNQFCSWPEYEESSFLSALSRFYRKGFVPFENDDSD